MVSVIMLSFLAFSLVAAHLYVERPSSGKPCILSLDVCNHGSGGLSGQSMPFIHAFAGKVFYTDFARPLEIPEQDFRPLLLPVSKEHPPKTDPRPEKPGLS